MPELAKELIKRQMIRLKEGDIVYYKEENGAYVQGTIKAIVIATDKLIVRINWGNDERGGFYNYSYAVLCRQTYLNRCENPIIQDKSEYNVRIKKEPITDKEILDLIEKKYKNYLLNIGDEIISSGLFGNTLFYIKDIHIDKSRTVDSFRVKLAIGRDDKICYSCTYIEAIYGREHFLGLLESTTPPELKGYYDDNVEFDDEREFIDGYMKKKIYSEHFKYERNEKIYNKCEFSYN